MRKLSLLALILGLAACRDSGGGGGDDTPGNDSGVINTDDVKIQDIQNDAMTSGTAVKIKGVVVTAIDNYGGKMGDFWIQEPEGGEFSGIHVFGAPLDQVAALTVGDVVDIAGAEKDEFQYMDFDPGYGITELKPISGGQMTITKTGANTPLQPQVVDALAIGAMTDFAARDAEWEKWEGVLIRVNNVIARDDQDCVGSMCNDSTLQKVEVTGGAVVESSLAAFPADYMAGGAINRGDCLGSVTGVLDYFFDYQILPRTTAEIDVNGTACPTEDTQALCGDSVDNDGNGFTDCNDNGCIVASSTCRMTYDITDLQPSASAVTGGVEIQNARVAGISFNKKNIWVQINQQAAANEGIYVRGPGDDLSTFALGDRVNIVGKALEFDNMTPAGPDTLTQIQAYAITAGTGASQAPTPVLNQLASSLLVAANGEPMESVLVELKNVKVTTVGASPNYITTLTQAGGTAFKGDDDIYRFKAADAGVCYSSIIGFWSYNVFENDWVFLPRLKVTGMTTGPDATVAGSPTACN